MQVHISSIINIHNNVSSINILLYIFSTLGKEYFILIEEKNTERKILNHKNKEFLKKTFTIS